MPLLRNARPFLAFLFVACAVCAQAQDFPNKPIRIVSNLGAGATPDIILRVMAPHLQQALGQPIVVDNKPGASGRIAYEHIATQVPADGYALLVSNQNLATARGFMKNLNFDPVTDLPAVSVLASTPLLLAVNNEQRFRTFTEMISFAKANPGKLFMGNGGVQTTHNLYMHAINRKYGVNLTGVPYKGGSPQMWLAVYTNEAQMSMFTEAAALNNATKVTPIAVTGERRLASFPNVPTFTELGLPEIVGVEYILHAPKGTPPQVIERIAAAVSTSLQRDDVKAALARAGLATVNAPPAEAQRRHAALATFFTDMVNNSGIQPE